MPATRRVLAAVSVVTVLATGVSAASAAAATVAVPLGCIIFTGNFSDKILPIVGSGFTPGGFVTISTSTTSKPTPTFLTSVQADANGNFGTASGAALFNSISTLDQTFNLFASQTGPPAVGAATTFRQVRAGVTRSPEPKRPSQRVKFSVRGFPAGKTVYAHFRHGGKTRATKSLGVAQGPCGITSKRMRALPTKSRLGLWKVQVDESKTYSKSTVPNATFSFTVFRRFI